MAGLQREEAVEAAGVERPTGSQGIEAWCPGQSSGRRGLCSRPEESGVQKPSRVREGDGSAAGEVWGASVGRARDPTPGQVSGWGSGEAIEQRL